MFGQQVIAIALPAGVGRFGQWIAAQHLKDRCNTVADALAEVARFKGRRDDLIDDYRRLRVGEAVFQPITDLDAQCAVVTGNDQQGTVVFVLLTDAPGAPQLVAEVFNGGALQIRHGHYHHLLAGGFFVGFKRLRQLLTRGGIEHLPVVHYPSAECGKCQRLGRGYK